MIDLNEVTLFNGLLNPEMHPERLINALKKMTVFAPDVITARAAITLANQRLSLILEKLSKLDEDNLALFIETIELPNTAGLKLVGDFFDKQQIQTIARDIIDFLQEELCHQK